MTELVSPDIARNQPELSDREKVGERYRKALESLGFTVVKQDINDLENEGLVRHGIGIAEYVATQTIPVEGNPDKKSEVKVIFTPHPTPRIGDNTIEFSLRTFLNDKDMGGNDDLNAGDFEANIANLIVVATFDISHGQLGWEQKYRDKKNEVLERLKA